MKKLFELALKPFKSASRQPAYSFELGGLKGVAILLVLLFHASILHRFTAFDSTSLPAAFYPLSRGVQLFFVVSGYSLARQYIDSFRVHDLIRFFGRRLARTWPLWWVICVVQFVFGNIELDRLFTNLFFLYGFSPDRDIVAATPVAWSLFVEEIFYLIFPAVMIVARRPLGAVAMLLLSILLRLEYQANLDLVGPITTAQWQHPYFHLFSLFLGILVFQIHKMLSQDAQNVHLVRAALDVCAAVALINLILPNGELEGSFCMAAIVLAAVWRQTLTAKIFRARVLQPFGFYCYGIYLLHGFVDVQVTLRFGANLLRSLESAWLEMFAVFFVSAALTLGIAIISYVLIENRFVRFAKRL